MSTSSTYYEEYARVRKHKLKVKDLAVEECVEDRSNTSLFSLRLLFCSVFLPQGYPHSVTSDYLDYQLWDTVQAFASSISGALATEAVLKGAGVGNEAATPLAASITWLVKDGLGMIGRILFSYSKGSQLDYDCKKWRLVADILNDAAFLIDLLCPLWPEWFLVSACTSSLFRCVVGVAGGATRTTIVQHQARRNNLADVAAKDGSQETLVNAFALIVSLVLLPAVSGRLHLVWSIFLGLVCLHLYANWRAVRRLQLDVLNGKRAAIVIREYLSTGKVPEIPDVNAREPLFHALYPKRRLGCSLKELLAARQALGSQNSTTFAVTSRHTLLYDRKSGRVWIAMCHGSTAADEFEAFFDAELAHSNEPNQSLSFDGLQKQLVMKGWRSDIHHLNFDEWTYHPLE